MARRQAAAPAETPAETTPDTAPAETATVTATTKVAIAGIRGTVDVVYDPETDTLGAIIARAAEAAGVQNIVIETLAPVVNGEDAALGDKVEPGSTVAAAPRTNNGS